MILPCYLDSTSRRYNRCHRYLTCFDGLVDVPTPVEWKQCRRRITIHECFKGDRSVVAASSMAVDLGIDRAEDATNVKCAMQCPERAEVECFQKASADAVELLSSVVLAMHAPTHAHTQEEQKKESGKNVC